MLGHHLDPKTVRVAHLARFATCSLQEVGRIAAVGTELDLVARRALEHHPASGELIVLLEGSVELVESGRVVSSIDAGGVVGPLAPEAGPTTCIRVGPSGATVLVFSANEVTALARDISTFASRVDAAPRFDARGRAAYHCASTCDALAESITRSSVARRARSRYRHVARADGPGPVAAHGGRTW